MLDPDVYKLLTDPLTKDVVKVEYNENKEEYERNAYQIQKTIAQAVRPDGSCSRYRYRPK